ncbi:MAG TPA: hypothetical protein VES67_08330 [Vicinamibacterales bacterium]|nr:hypothetical protein [Vicinamibacterales bacterium]
MRKRFIVLLLGSIVVAGTDAQAQTCRGSVPIGRMSHGIVDVGTAFSKYTNSYGANVGGGSDRWFAGGGIQGLHYSDLDARTWAVTGIGGAQIDADAGRYFMICPMSAVTFERANAIFGDDVSARTLTLSGGAAVGINAFQDTMVSLVPTVGLFVSRASTLVDVAGDRVTVGETYSTLQAGVGVLLGERASITPMLVIPIGLEGGQKTFSLSYAFSFGRR